MSCFCPILELTRGPKMPNSTYYSHMCANYRKQRCVTTSDAGQRKTNSICQMNQNRNVITQLYIYQKYSYQW